MVWVLLLSSIMGFVVANAVATDPTWLSSSHWMTGQLAQLQTIRLISGSLGVLLLGIMWWQSRRPKPAPAPVTLTAFGLPLSQCALGAVITLWASLSHGLISHAKYQARLLKQPITVTATITPTQISDHITDTVTLTDQALKSSTYQIGGHQSRHVWQITALQPDASDNSISQEARQPVVPLPLNVWVSADTGKHPEWQPTLNALVPGQQLKVKLALLPIEQPQYQVLPAKATPVNLGFDTALWLRQRDIQATAQLVDLDEKSLATRPVTSLTEHWHQRIERTRWQLRHNVVQHLKRGLGHQALTDSPVQSALDSHAIVLGLLTGDKALMGSDIKYLYQVTGISHLLAISGPHVTLLASLIALLVLGVIKVMAPKLLLRLPSRLIMLWVSVGVAGVYALLVGFELPAQRTFWLLVLATLATQWLVQVSGYRLLAWIGILLLWLDSTAAVQAGFWLSFIAVGLLLKFSEYNALVNNNIRHRGIGNGNRDQVSVSGLITHLWHSAKMLLGLQLWLFVWMMPVVVWFFGQVSIVGIGVNLVAVPLLGLIIVPMDMLAGLLSLIPSIGHWLSYPLWSLLVEILDGFHAGLAAVVASGVAKPLFMSIMPNQLLLVAIGVGLLFGRGVLPRLAMVPLVIAGIALPFSARQQSAQFPQLTVLSHAQFGISLVVKGETAWLILADNRKVMPVQARANLAKSVKAIAPFTTQQEEGMVATLLNTHIYPLLASQHVRQLTGVISQTPSITNHLLVQQLAATLPVNAYWQAGFDPLVPLQDSAGQNLTYPYISAKPCQFGQQWSHQGLQIEAMTGWSLNLANAQIGEADKRGAQTCFVQLTHTGEMPYRVMIAAGHSALPMQLATQLCQPARIDLLLTPYALALDRPWLLHTMPKHIHSLTGSWENQRMGESNQFALLQLANKLGQAKQPLGVTEAHQVGALRYRLDPTATAK